MTIRATMPGHMPTPPTDSRRRCVRCGLKRQVNRGTRDSLCSSCREVCDDLGERGRWT